MDDADDSIMDIKNQIQELENIWRDTYVDFESLQKILGLNDMTLFVSYLKEIYK